MKVSDGVLKFFDVFKLENAFVYGHAFVLLEVTGSFVIGRRGVSWMDNGIAVCRFRFFSMARSYFRPCVKLPSQSSTHGQAFQSCSTVLHGWHSTRRQHWSARLPVATCAAKQRLVRTLAPPMTPLLANTSRRGSSLLVRQCLRLHGRHEGSFLGNGETLPIHPPQQPLCTALIGAVAADWVCR